MLKSLLLSTAMFALPAAAAGQELETVIDTANRIPTPAAQVASSVTVIDAATIQARQQQSLPDVLETVPGLFVEQTGGIGGQTSLFLRGANANHTKVIVDGIDISDPSSANGGADVGKYLTADIAKVEVLRGPQSGLYGSDAIGGVVSITTKKGEGIFSLSGSLEGGSFDSFNQSASAQGSDGGFHYAATVDHVHAGATPVTPLDLLKPGETRNDDYFDGTNLSGRFGYDLSDHADLGLVTRYSGNLSRITGDAFDPKTFASFPSPAQTRLYTQQYQSRVTAHWNAGWLDETVGLGYSSTVISDLDPDNGSFPSSGDRIKLDWQGNARLSAGETVVLGAETARDAVHRPIGAGITTNAGFAELRSDLGSGFAGSAAIRYDDNSKFGGKTTWRLAPAYVVGGFKLKASVGTGFKAPSLEQLFQSFPAFGFFANPNLKPESSTGYDVGAEENWGAFGLGTTFFHNHIRNLITNNAGFTTDINIGKAMTKGVESFASWQASEALNLRADYTYTDAVDETTHLPLIRRPRHKASLTAGWRPIDALSLDATLLYVGPQVDGNRDFSIPRLKLSGYTLVNLAASWKASDRLSLYGRLENALDTRYQSPDGFLRPGLGVFAGIRGAL
jgi:vitamin B12 transporter